MSLTTLLLTASLATGQLPHFRNAQQNEPSSRPVTHVTQVTHKQKAPQSQQVQQAGCVSGACGANVNTCGACDTDCGSCGCESAPAARTTHKSAHSSGNGFFARLCSLFASRSRTHGHKKSADGGCESCDSCGKADACTSCVSSACGSVCDTGCSSGDCSTGGCANGACGGAVAPAQSAPVSEPPAMIPEAPAKKMPGKVSYQEPPLAQRMPHQIQGQSVYNPIQAQPVEQQARNVIPVSGQVAPQQVAPQAYQVPQQAQNVKSPLLPQNLTRVGHEGDYSWITGQLQNVGGRWVIHYAGPNVVDRFGGIMPVVAVNTIDMRTFQNGDLVTVHGGVMVQNGQQGIAFRAAAVDLIERSR